MVRIEKMWEMDFRMETTIIKIVGQFKQAEIVDDVCSKLLPKLDPSLLRSNMFISTQSG